MERSGLNRLILSDALDGTYGGNCASTRQEHTLAAHSRAISSRIEAYSVLVSKSDIRIAATLSMRASSGSEKRTRNAHWARAEKAIIKRHAPAQGGGLIPNRSVDRDTGAVGVRAQVGPHGPSQAGSLPSSCEPRSRRSRSLIGCDLIGLD